MGQVMKLYYAKLAVMSASSHYYPATLQQVFKSNVGSAVK
jgi:hypothetical protein